MIYKTFQFTFMELAIDVSQVENDLGYREGLPDMAISDMIKEVFKDCETLTGIKAEFRIFDDLKFDESEKSVILNKIRFEINNIIYGQLKKCRAIAIFLCTAGKDISERSRKAMIDGDLLRGYIYDAIGSEVVEAAADLMQAELDIMAAGENKTISNRFSPGYCGWNVIEQHKLFQLMHDNFCGIRLTESALMDPMKSESGFIGIGKKIKRVPYSCSFCDMKDCFYRKHA